MTEEDRQDGDRCLLPFFFCERLPVAQNRVKESFHQIWSNNSRHSCDNAAVPARVFINNENTLLFQLHTEDADSR